MAVTRNINRTTGNTFLVNATNYLSIGGLTTAITTEANAQITYRSAGTLANLFADIKTNTVTAASTLRSRKNTANGNQSVSVGSSLTGVFEDTVNSDTVAAADKLNYQVVTGATGTSMVIVQFASTFSATTNTVKKHVLNNGNTFTVASVTVFVPISGTAILTTSTTESTFQYKAKLAGTLTNLQVHVSTNTRPATTFGSRKNTAAGTLTLSVGASLTGFFEDTTHSDTIASGDLINYTLTTGTGTNSMLVDNIAAEFTTTTGTFFFLAANSNTTGTAINTTQWFGMEGDTQGQVVAEAQDKNTPRVAFTAGNLQIKVTANLNTATSTLLLRQNSVNSALSASITASTTGFFEDIIDTVNIATTDSINFQITTGATGGNLTYILMSATATPTVAPATSIGGTLMMMGVG